MSTLKRLRVALPFARLSDDALVSRLKSVHDAMKDNPSFPNPPQDLAAFQTDINNFGQIVAEALDGSKRAIAEKQRQRHAIIKVAEALGHYVQANCDDDRATMTSAGFEPVSYVRAAQEPLSPPRVAKVDEGNHSGQLQVRITASRKALHYELRHAAAGSDGVPGEWSSTTLTQVKTMVPVDNLTPGIIYVFQVRGFGRLGYTDWSDSVSRMCI
jgi:hypothetical protein